LHNLNLEISPEEFLFQFNQPSFNGKILYIKEEWEQSHLNIEGALSFPFQHLPKMVPFLNKKQTYYLICSQGHRSMYASAYLTYLEFENILTIQDGIEGLKNTIREQQVTLSWIS
jgi:rhodanese-related sulfurtransferase